MSWRKCENDRSTHENAALGEIIHGDGEMVLGVHGPLVQGPRETSKVGRCEDVDHVVAEEVEAIDRCFSGDAAEGLRADELGAVIRSLGVTYIDKFVGGLMNLCLE